MCYLGRQISLYCHSTDCVNTGEQNWFNFPTALISAHLWSTSLHSSCFYVDDLHNSKHQLSWFWVWGRSYKEVWPMADRGRVHELRLKTNIVFGATSDAEPHWKYSLLSVFLHIQWKNEKNWQLEERKAPGIKTLSSHCTQSKHRHTQTFTLDPQLECH